MLHFIRLILRRVCHGLGLVSACIGLAAHATPVDTARFYELLRQGEAIYSQKQGYASFSQSLVYFDSAQAIAEQSGDPALLARSTAGRGSVYDAWNKEPAKTIALFTNAAELYRKAGDEEQYLYHKHLVAHAYDKIGDSLHATTVLRELIDVLQDKPAGWRDSLGFVPEMALIATEVKAYALADSILRLLTRRAAIINDPATYNYLDHYYLTQARLDTYWRTTGRGLYADSLARTFEHLHSPSDQLYYATQLAVLYAAAGKYERAYHFAKAKEAAQDALFADRGELENMQRALAASEAAASQRKAAYEATLTRGRAYAIWVLSTLLAVITVLSMYLYRRNKKYQAQSLNLQAANAKLDKHAGQVELLNKEIQHRIKNNLYTIYSLLHMQEDSTDNEEVLAHLSAARMRVESVAALHDHLLGSTGTVDFGAYLKVLVNKVVECFADERRVITHIQSEPVALPVNTCFALSLILNEWITNSIKYARTRTEVLNMDISIGYGHNEVCIDYADDGEPVAAGPAQKSGLGTEIIRLLTVQINGRLTSDERHPYHYQLCIPTNG